MDEDHRVWVLLAGQSAPVRTSDKTTRLAAEVAQYPAMQQHIFFYYEEPEDEQE